MPLITEVTCPEASRSHLINQLLWEASSNTAAKRPKELGNIHPVMRPAEGDSNDLGLCGMRLSILVDFDKAGHMVERAPEFAIAVQVISDYLKKNMNRS